MQWGAARDTPLPPVVAAPEEVAVPGPAAARRGPLPCPTLPPGRLGVPGLLHGTPLGDCGPLDHRHPVVAAPEEVAVPGPAAARRGPLPRPALHGTPSGDCGPLGRRRQAAAMYSIPRVRQEAGLGPATGQRRRRGVGAVVRTRTRERCWRGSAPRARTWRRAGPLPLAGRCALPRVGLGCLRPSLRWARPLRPWEWVHRPLPRTHSAPLPTLERRQCARRCRRRDLVMRGRQWVGAVAQATGVQAGQPQLPRAPP
jgi:hypothetical protein